MSLDRNRASLLLGFYGNLLTERQNEVLDYYLNQDFSMQEIADDLEISKSAVSDIIHRSIELLEEYDEKLNLISDYHKRYEVYELLEKLNIDIVNKYVKELKDIE